MSGTLKRLEGNVAIDTGTGRSIGEAIAMACTREGARVSRHLPETRITPR